MENEACAQAKIYSFCIRDGISFNWIFAGEHARDFALFSLQAIIADANFSSRSFFFLRAIEKNRRRWLYRPSKKRVNFRNFHTNILTIYQLREINFKNSSLGEHIEGNT